ncbi:MAG: ion transporter [Schwartzia sp. (in: firmicutes)]
MDILEKALQWKHTQKIITVVILLNAAVLGLLTNRTLSVDEISLLESIDKACLGIFTIELVAKLLVERRKFWSDGWNIFDFVIVLSSILFMSSSISVLRAFRIFRLLKALAEFPELQILVSSMLKAIPSMTWALLLLFIVFYIFAVFGSTMYGDAFPELFGDIGASMFTLFQVMTFESWATAVARPIMEIHPHAWIYFLTFILLTAVTLLNVMVGIVVEAVSSIAEAVKQEQAAAAGETALPEDRSDEEREAKIQKHLEEIEALLKKH